MIFINIVNRPSYLAPDHWWDFRYFIIQTELSRLLDHRRDSRAFIIQIESPRRWSSSRFLNLYYTDRVTSLLTIGEIFYHRRDSRAFINIIQTELPRSWYEFNNEMMERDWENNKTPFLRLFCRMRNRSLVSEHEFTCLVDRSVTPSLDFCLYFRWPMHNLTWRRQKCRRMVRQIWNIVKQWVMR